MIPRVTSAPGGVPPVNLLSEDTAPDIAADFFLEYDASASAHKKVNPSVLVARASGFATGLFNGTLVESHSGNAATFAIKTLAGNDPSATDPVYAIFRNATATTGDFVIRRITAALSVTLSSGSTIGTANGAAFKLWLVLIDNAGTVLLGVVKPRATTSIMALNEDQLISTTAEGGAGAADSAQVFYASSAVSNKAFRVAGYAEYSSGLTTAGTWNASPTKLQVYGPGVALPGTIVQSVTDADAADATGSTTMPNDDTIPQKTEGVQFMSQAITPYSAANVLRITHVGMYSNTAVSGSLVIALFQDAASDALAAMVWGREAVAGRNASMGIEYEMLAGTASSTTFKIRAGAPGAGTMEFNGQASARLMGGVMGSFLRITEFAT